MQEIFLRHVWVQMTEARLLLEQNILSSIFFFILAPLWLCRGRGSVPKWHKVIWFISTRMANPKTTTAAQETLASNSTAEQLASFDIISLLSASRTRLTGAQARAANAFIRLAKILSQATSRAQNRQLTSRDTKEIIFTRPERHKERSEKTKHQIGRSKNRNRKKKAESCGVLSRKSSRGIK